MSKYDPIYFDELFKIYIPHILKLICIIQKPELIQDNHFKIN